ncbi:MAG: nicotinate-nucleotide adenylyltransferase [Coriobacteriales bacterium]
MASREDAALSQVAREARLMLSREPSRHYELGVMGGTFDPIHLGHTRAAAVAQRELALDRVLFVPASTPSFKRDRRIAGACDRLAMVRIATADEPLWSVCAEEIARGGVSYTSETLEGLSTCLPVNVRLSFILGTDSLATLPTWHDAGRIAQLARIVCVSRRGEDDDAALRGVETSGMGFEVSMLSGDVPDVSSTQVRELIREGSDVSRLVDPRVLAYVRLHGLYRDGDGNTGCAVQVRR